MDTSNQIRAASYYRVSTLLGQSVENQAVPIREYCKARGFNLPEARQYSDVGLSGANQRRPSLDALMKDARRGLFKVVVVAALDRFGRNTKHILTLLEELHALNITFVSLKEGLDFGTPVGRMTMTCLAAIAELERETIRWRIKESLAAKKIIAERTGNGWRCGRRPVATPEMIEAIIDLRSQGLSVRAIEERLDRRVSHSTIGKIIRQKANNGS